jgi:hypothetical protein
MARILLTWELGGGFGHLMNLRPLAIELAARGHQVFLAAGDLSRVAGVFAAGSGQCSVVGGQLAPGSAEGSEAPSPRPSPTGRGSERGITVLPAPWKTTRTKTVETIVTYADLLLNIGFGDGEAFTVHLQAWRNLYELVQPDLLVCDHSPTALLAARTLTAARGTLTPALSPPRRIFDPGEREEGARTSPRRVPEDPALSLPRPIFDPGEREIRFPVATVGTGFFTPVDESPLRLLRRVPPEELPAVRAREQRLLDIMNSQLAAGQESGGRSQESAGAASSFIVHRLICSSA